MEHLGTILAALATTTGAISGSLSVGQWLVNYLRSMTRERRTAEILHFLNDVGCVSESDVRELVKAWQPPFPVTQEVRDELTLLLTNLTRGARFHSTQGTPLSSYLRCERLIQQLLEHLVPKRRAGQEVGPGRRDWVLKRFLGMGSFGEVWVGQNRLFPEQRAFKFFTQEGARDWLEQEANALSQIKSRLGNCPNAIRYEDIAIDAEPYPFLVLEFVGGGSLEEWILSPPADRRPLDVHELMTGIARGLAEAHNHRIFHRDLKPANVLLSDEPDPVPKIADFGLSRVETDASAGSSLASQSVLVGTGMYLPPESADPYMQRRPAQDDVFAFGVVWYQTLVGRIERPPYDFVDRLHNQGVDSRTIRLLSRCLAHPSRRYPDGGTLLADLEVETGPEVWNVPDGCFDVGPLAREYIDSQLR